MWREVVWLYHWRKCRFLRWEVFVDHLDQPFCTHGLVQKKSVLSAQTSASRLSSGDGGGEKDDGNVFEFRVSADLSLHIPAIHAGHEHVEKDQVRKEIPRCSEGVRGRVFFANFEASRLLQVQANHSSERGFIVDDQDAAFFHRSFTP